MRKLWMMVAVFFVAALLWLAIWHAMMSGDVARVKASIDYHYQHLREVNRTMSLKADAVYATGFPFSFMVAIEGATLSMVEGDETFAVEIPKLTLASSDAALGRYRVNLPATVEALYAKNGAPPEHYIVTPDAMPQLMLSAQNGNQRCGALTGVRCVPTEKNAPLVSYAVGVPASISLHMQLAGEVRDATFTLSPIAITLPIFQPIPQDMSRSLQLFVGVLREALVFKTPIQGAQPVQ